MNSVDSLNRIIENLSKNGKVFYYGSTALFNYKKYNIQIYRILTDVNLAKISQFVKNINFLKNSKFDFYTIIENDIWVTFLTEDIEEKDNFLYLKEVNKKYKNPFLSFIYSPVYKKYFTLSDNSLRNINTFLKKTDFNFLFEDLLDLSLIISEFNINIQNLENKLNFKNTKTVNYDKIKFHQPLIDKIITSKNPYLSLKFLNFTGLLEILFPFLNDIKGINQDRFLHPEGDVFDHTLQCFKFVKNPSLELFYGLLLHDYGKAAAKTKKSFYGHSTYGSKKVKELLMPLGFSKKFISDIEFLVEYHMVNTYYYKLSDYEKNRYFNNELGLDLLRLFKADLLGSVGRLDSYLDIISDLRKIQKKSFRNKLFEEIKNLNLEFNK